MQQAHVRDHRLGRGELFSFRAGPNQGVGSCLGFPSSRGLHSLQEQAPAVHPLPQRHRVSLGSSRFLCLDLMSTSPAGTREGRSRRRPARQLCQRNEHLSDQKIVFLVFTSPAASAPVRHAPVRLTLVPACAPVCNCRAAVTTRAAVSAWVRLRASSWMPRHRASMSFGAAVPMMASWCKRGLRVLCLSDQTSPRQGCIHRTPLRQNPQNWKARRVRTERCVRPASPQQVLPPITV
jgi:hypothetical protein